MGEFRKVPVEIEAWPVRQLIHDAAHCWGDLPEQVRDAYEGENEGVRGIVFTPTEIHVTTLEGVMVAAIDDMLICGVRGELYPCKPDIFAATYEPVD